MRLESMETGSLAVNCYIIMDEETKETFIIDPGGNVDRIQKRLDEIGGKPKAIILTHGHGDHIGGVTKLREVYGIPLWVHQGDSEMILDAKKNLSYFIGISIKLEEADYLLKDGEEISLGKMTFQILHTPGHSPGGICIYGQGIVITGDTLFAGSIGRTDFPSSSTSDLMHSLTEKLAKLPPETKVYPGHGPASNIAYELKFNPFMTTSV